MVKLAAAEPRIELAVVVGELPKRPVLALPPLTMKLDALDVSVSRPSLSAGGGTMSVPGDTSTWTPAGMNDLTPATSVLVRVWPAPPVEVRSMATRAAALASVDAS